MGLAVSMMQKPWEGQPNGIYVPVAFSLGWWHADMVGSSLRSIPSTWKLPNGTGSSLVVSTLHRKRCRLGCAGHVHVGDHEIAAAVDVVGNRGGGMGRRANGGGQSRPRDEPARRHLVDIDNDEAAETTSRLQPVTEAERIMAPVRVLVPSRLFAGPRMLRREIH
jgi:hypothetical protein